MVNGVEHSEKYLLPFIATSVKYLFNLLFLLLLSHLHYLTDFIFLLALFFLKIAMAILCISRFHVNFRTICQSKKNVH